MARDKSPIAAALPLPHLSAALVPQDPPIAAANINITSATTANHFDGTRLSTACSADPYRSYDTLTLEPVRIYGVGAAMRKALDLRRSRQQVSIHVFGAPTAFLSSCLLTYCMIHSNVCRMAQGDTPPLALELRRGVIVLATLSQLRLPRYGYELRQALADYGMAIEEGTLYPLLRRLETQGVLKSEWRTNEGSPRRYYTLSADGRKLFRSLTETWHGLNEAMDRLLAHGGSDGR